MSRRAVASLALLAAWPGPARAQVPSRPAEGQFPEPPAAEAASPAPASAEPAPAPELAALPPSTPPPTVPVQAATDGSVLPRASTAPPADLPTSPPNKPSKFYSALGLGAGYFHATSGATEDTRRFSGGSFAVQLVMAGRTGKQRTLTVGGAYLREQVYGLSSTDELIDGDEPRLDDVTFGLWLLGFFMDVAVSPEPGLHFQAIAGFSGLDVGAPTRDTDDPFGIALNLGVGYDFRVGRHLALGALLRSTFAPLDVDESGGTAVTSLAPSLLLVATTR